MSDLDPVYARLREVMLSHADRHVVATDAPGMLSVEGAPRDQGPPSWRAGVQAKKNYVSYHLMAVYEDPTLLDGISPELRARMQGKSCFNFKKVDDELFAQLSSLTGTALARTDA